jgi:hypothetical protein
MTDADVQRIIASIPPKYVGGTVGALLAPLLVKNLLGENTPILQALSVPLGWTLGYNIAPEQLLVRNVPIRTLN